MAAPLTQTDSHSSDYFDDDPAFNEALANLDDRTLFGSQPLACLDNLSDDSCRPSSQTRKRKRSVSPPAGPENSQEDTFIIEQPDSEEDSASTNDGGSKRSFPTIDRGSPTTAKSDTYDAAKFGGFRDYFRRKRAKLQNQNADINTQDGRLSQSTLFKGVEIYVTGRVVPSLQILRALITRHGGEFHAYLDRKEMVTHVITSNLTPAKALEFKHMKVVRPEWLVDSEAANKLLPWTNYQWTLRLDIPTQVFALSSPFRLSSDAPPSSPAQPMVKKKDFAKTSGSGGAQISVKTPRSLTGNAQNDEPMINPAGSVAPPQMTIPVAQKKPGEVSTRIVERLALTTLPSKPLQPSTTCPPPDEPTTLVSKIVTIPQPSLSRNMPPPPAPAGPSRPSYAAHTSNPEAERLMKSAAWRGTHTSASGETYIQGYYQHSRLHHLSKWKAELRDLVAKAQEDAESQISSDIPDANGPILRKDKNKGKDRARETVIMHCDFDCFFVAAGIVSRPELKGKPVAVCHASGTGAGHSTSEIASASYAARAFGVKNGMSLGQARQLCPEIQTIPYEFERYKELSRKFYTILMAISDDLQAVSVDEALVDVSSAVESLRAHALKHGQLRSESYEKEIAEKIRNQVRAATGCEVSVGIGPNIMLARIATRRAKPASSFYLSIADAPAHIVEMDIVNLHGFAGAVRDKAMLSFGTSKLGDLAGKSKDVLQRALGDKSGERIWNAIRGIDDRVLESDKPRKSVSADVNYGIRFENNEHAENFVYGLGQEVSDRLKAINKRGRTLTLKILKRHPDAPKEAPKFMGHGKCETFNKTCPISGPRSSATDDPNIIGREAWKLLQAMSFDPTELRGIGIQIQKLDGADAPRSLAQGQLAMRFEQAIAKTNPPKPAILAPLVPQNSIIDIDSLSDSQIFKPPLGRKDAPYDLTMLSQLDQDDVAQVLNCGIDHAHSLSTSRLRQPQLGSSKVGSLSPRRQKRLSNMGPPTTIRNPTKYFPIFSRQLAPVPDHELVSLNIDPMAYAKMTKPQQKALVFARRTQKGLDGAGRPIHQRKRRFQEASSNRVHKAVQAVKVELPKLRAAKPGAPTVTETGDIQDMMRRWVEGKVSKKLGPDPREVAHFSTFLEKSMATDLGMQRAVEVMKWWKHVCMSSWGVDDERRGHYGREWWEAWWNVKDKLDGVVKSRFGGKLSLD